MNMPKNPTIQRIIQNLAKKGATEQREAAQELAEAIGGSEDILVRAQTVFPFKLFPTTVSVDRTQMTITERDFFRTGEVVSIRIEDMLNITTHVGPILGAIRVTSRFFNPDKPYVVNYLHRADALKIKRIVQGYLIARQQKIDTSKLPARELATMLDELGKVAPPERV